MQLDLEDVQEFRFTVVKGSNPGAKISFEPLPRVVHIGRSVENDIVVADSSVSRRHARVELRGDGYTIADLGSSAGLEKMGFRVGASPEPLASGDEFRLGDTILRFEVVAKRGAIKRTAARAAGEAPKPSPITNVVEVFRRALSTMGLRTPIMQAAGAVCFVVLTVIGLWPDAPTIPFQDRSPLPLDYTAVWGYGVGDDEHADGVVFDVPKDAEGVGVFLRIRSGGGVEIRAGGRSLQKIPAGGDWSSQHVLVLPAAIAVESAPRVVVDHLGYSADDGPVAPDEVPIWGVGRAWAVRVPTASASAERLSADLVSLRELNTRLDDAPSHRFEVARGLRTAMIGLMKLSGRPAVAFEIPVTVGASFTGSVDDALAEVRAGRFERAVDRLLPALQIAEVELNREYTRLANTLTVLEKKQSGPEIALLVPQILKLIPDPTDVRHRRGLEAAGTLLGPDLDAYQSAMREP